MAYYDPYMTGSYFIPETYNKSPGSTGDIGSDPQDGPDESVVSFPYTEDWSGSKQGRMTFPKMKT